MAGVLVVKRTLCPHVHGHDVRAGWKKIDEFLLDVFPCLRGGIFKVARLQAFNHLFSKRVPAVVLLDCSNGPLRPAINLLFGQILFGIASHAFIAIGGKTGGKLRVVRQEDWCATLSLAGEVCGVFCQPVVHDHRRTVFVDDLAVAKPAFKFRAGRCLQAEFCCFVGRLFFDGRLWSSFFSALYLSSGDSPSVRFSTEDHRRSCSSITLTGLRDDCLFVSNVICFYPAQFCVQAFLIVPESSLNVCQRQINTALAQLGLRVTGGLVHKCAVRGCEWGLFQHFVLILVDGVGHLFKIVVKQKLLVCIACGSFCLFKPFRLCRLGAGLFTASQVFKFSGEPKVFVLVPQRD